MVITLYQFYTDSHNCHNSESSKYLKSIIRPLCIQVYHRHGNFLRDLIACTGHESGRVIASSRQASLEQFCEPHNLSSMSWHVHVPKQAPVVLLFLKQLLSVAWRLFSKRAVWTGGSYGQILLCAQYLFAWENLCGPLLETIYLRLFIYWSMDLATRLEF